MKAFKFCLLMQLIFLYLLLFFQPVQARVITQITPTLTITEEYTDNYFSQNSDRFEEWTTTYELGFTMGFLNQKSQIYLEYNPEYQDYKNQNELDSLDHNASLSATFQPTKFTQASADLSYDGHDANNTGQSWEHSAVLSVDSQLTKTIKASLAQEYTKSYDEQVRTGEYKEHQTNTTQAGITKAFGAKNAVGAYVTYEFDQYTNSDADEYTSIEPTAFFKYWFTRLNGMEINTEYTWKEFDNSSDNDYDTIAGDIRYIHKFNRHLDGYIKYRHYLSDRQDGEHTIYHPSVGVDWDIKEDAGVSVGVGVLFHEWDNDNEDSQDPFIDLNAYKVFNFSPRGSLSITGSSKYEESSEDAASLGYNTSYQVGFSLDYELTRRLTSSLFGSYEIQDFKEDNINRQDDTAEIGGGLIWNPLKWLQIRLNASHTNFTSDDDLRDDYRENKVTFLVRFIPEKPIRPDKMVSRKSLEKQIFHR